MNAERVMKQGIPGARVYAVTSGKGGVGKTSISVNLSIVLSTVGLKVLLIDADTGLANVDLMTGISAPRTIEDVMNGDASIFEALAEGPEQLTILPASSGLGHVDEMGDRGVRFKRELTRLENAFDMIFIDTGAGISANVVDFVFMADEVLVVMTPEPTAFADAYAMVKLVSMKKPDMRVGIILNVVSGEQDAARLFEKFREIVNKFLGRDIKYRGCVVRDKNVQEAIMRQVPLMLHAPKAPASDSIRSLARNLLGMKDVKKKTIFSR